MEMEIILKVIGLTIISKVLELFTGVMVIYFLAFGKMDKLQILDK
jgi:hypothetical protein